MSSGVAVAVVGATGAVGETTLKLLEQRRFPVKSLRAYASERSVGKSVTFSGESSFKGIEMAFFSAGAAQAKEYAPIAAAAGAAVIDKSSAFRMDPKVPLVVPEINAYALRGHQGIISCPNCTTIITVMPLKPLHNAGRLRRVVATSYQAVSGAGVKGIEELRSQTQAWVRGVNAETELHVSPEQAREAFRQFPGLQVWDTPEENRYPMPATVEGQDDCVVGRIRQDLSHPNTLNLWVVGDQLRKGAALNGLQIAECLLSQS